MVAGAGIIAAMAQAPAAPPADSTAPTAGIPDRPPTRLSRRGIERLDLLLLSVEALDLNGGEAMVWMCEQLGFSVLFPDRVSLWKSRCHNPLRRTTRRGVLSELETDALIRILCALARLCPCPPGDGACEAHHARAAAVMALALEDDADAAGGEELLLACGCHETGFRVELQAAHGPAVTWWQLEVPRRERAALLAARRLRLLCINNSACFAREYVRHFASFLESMAFDNPRYG
jgi:hypothetical protein